MGMFCNTKKQITIPQEFHFAIDERIPPPPPPSNVADMFDKVGIFNSIFVHFTLILINLFSYLIMYYYMSIFSFHFIQNLSMTNHHFQETLLLNLSIFTLRFYFLPTLLFVDI